jgi:hypothetical protein
VRCHVRGTSVFLTGDSDVPPRACSPRSVSCAGIAVKGPGGVVRSAWECKRQTCSKTKVGFYGALNVDGIRLISC